jgi:uncharacterized protein YkwD
METGMRLKRLLGSLIIIGLVMGCGLESHAFAPASETSRQDAGAHARQNIRYGWDNPPVYLPLIINPSIPTPTLVPTNTPVPTNPPIPTNTPGPNGCSVTHNGAFEEQLYEQINNIRDDYGLAPLVVNYNLEISAGGHSDDMALNNFMSHVGSDGRTFWQRAQDAGYTGRWGGEIIMYGSTSPSAAIAWWMGDQPHRDMILSDTQDFGAGYAHCLSNYYTVDFGHR